MATNGRMGIEMGFHRDLFFYGISSTTMGNLMGIPWDVVGIPLCLTWPENNMFSHRSMIYKWVVFQSYAKLMEALVIGLQVDTSLSWFIYVHLFMVESWNDSFFYAQRV